MSGATGRHAVKTRLTMVRLRNKFASRLRYLVLLFIVTGVVSIDPEDLCLHDIRQVDMEPCLEKIRQIFVNDTAFWFGIQHDERCSPQEIELGLFTNIDCVDLHRSHGHTLEERLFKNTSFFTPKLVDRYLNVTIVSAKSSFEGCRHVISTEGEEVNLNPLSDTLYEPWTLRGEPVVSVELEGDTLSITEYYTLIILDPGFHRTHGLYINFDGSDIDQAHPIIPYHGSLNARYLPNVYVWLLFNQNGMIGSVNNSIYEHLRGFDIVEIIQELNLTGPVAVNWYLSSYDVYSVQMMKNTGALENCASLVRDRLRIKKSAFTDDDPYLSIFMMVDMHMESFAYEMCGNTNSFKAEDIQVDPLGMGILDPAQIQSRLLKSISVKVSMNKLRPDASKDFAGNRYTLMLVDPDVSEQCLGDGGHPLLIMASVDLNVVPSNDGWATLDLLSGKTILPYVSPDPIDTSTHTIYFLLYQQGTDSIGISTYQDRRFRYYRTDHCPSFYRGRCAFDIRMFATVNALELVGASWFMISRSDWSAKQHLSDPSAYCADPIGWKPESVCKVEQPNAIFEVRAFNSCSFENNLVRNWVLFITLYHLAVRI